MIRWACSIDIERNLENGESNLALDIITANISLFWDEGGKGSRGNNDGIIWYKWQTEKTEIAWKNTIHRCRQIYS